jgi:hypothetical protein
MVSKGLTGEAQTVIPRADSAEPRNLALHPPPSYPRRRVSSTPRPIGSIAAVSGILDRPVKPDDDSRRGRRMGGAKRYPSAPPCMAMSFAALYPPYENTPPHSRGAFARALPTVSPKQEGARSPRIVIHRKYALGQPDCIFRIGGPCSLIRNSAWFAGAKAWASFLVCFCSWRL